MANALLMTMFTVIWATAEAKSASYQTITSNPGIAFSRVNEVNIAREEKTIVTAIDLSKLSDWGHIYKIYTIITQANEAVTAEYEVVATLGIINNYISQLKEDRLEINQLINLYEVDTSLADENKQNTRDSLLTLDKIEHIKDVVKYIAVVDKYFVNNDIALKIDELPQEYENIIKIATLVGNQKINSSADEQTKLKNIRTATEALSNMIMKKRYIVQKVIDILRNNKFLLSQVAIHAFLDYLRTNHNQKLPLALSNINSVTFQEVSTTRIRIFSNKIFIEIVVPLVDNQEFVLYKLIPLPVFQNSSKKNAPVAAYIQPHNDYIAISKFNDTYFYANKREIKDCKTMNKHLICADNREIATGNSCEFKLFTEPTFEILQKCDIRIMQAPTNFIIGTNNPYLWLFSVKNNKDIMIICGDEKSTLPNDSAGILEMPNDCVIKNDNKLIRGVNGIRNNDELIIPEVNLVVINIDLVIKANITEYSNHNQKLLAIAREEHSVKRLQELYYLQSNVIMYIILIIALGVIIYKAFNVVKKHFSNYNNQEEVDTINTEATYMPMNEIDPNLKLNFKGIGNEKDAILLFKGKADYDKPLTPPRRVVWDNVQLGGDSIEIVSESEECPFAEEGTGSKRATIMQNRKA